MRYELISVLGVLTALVMADTSSSTKKTCYSMNGEVLDSVYQPCNPDAEYSACCALNGTSGQNDICMDSGLCMSTSGWYSTFLYANGCTDPTGKAKACPQACSFMPTGYSFSVLQCNANNGSFCCRAGGDETNCCNDTSSSFQADGTIGQILLPGTNETVNTTYSTIIPSPSKDKSGVVGGVLGGVLGAALIASLLALWYILRSRRSLKNSYVSLQNERDTALQQGASEKAALQHQIEQQQLQYQQYQQQQMQAPTYSPGSGQYHTYFAPSAALPMQPYPSEVSSNPRPIEMDGMRGASELSSETVHQEVERIVEKPKKTD